MSDTVWDDCVSSLQNELPAQQFNTWIRPLQLADEEPSVLTLVAPNRFVMDWVNDKYKARIQELIRQCQHNADSHLKTLVVKVAAQRAPAFRANVSQRPVNQRAANQRVVNQGAVNQGALHQREQQPQALAAGDDRSPPRVNAEPQNFQRSLWADGDGLASTPSQAVRAEPNRQAPTEDLPQASVVSPAPQSDPDSERHTIVDSYYQANAYGDDRGRFSEDNFAGSVDSELNNVALRRPSPDLERVEDRNFNHQPLNHYARQFEQPHGFRPEAAKTSASNDRKEIEQGLQHKSNLNNTFTFENFVIGKSNQLGLAAATQVAENPGGSYNPLFVYGGVGLGKTHLMHSVGNALIKRKPDAKVIYLHSERFVADMVKALQLNAINDFKRFYRSVDALLIDDIQFFAGKERSQEEFFHTFKLKTPAEARNFSHDT